MFGTHPRACFLGAADRLNALEENVGDLERSLTQTRGDDKNKRRASKHGALEAKRDISSSAYAENKCGDAQQQTDGREARSRRRPPELQTMNKRLAHGTETRPR
jgi:hypothetical protein